MFKLYRCQICGDPYLGDSAPSECPFCGAKKEYFVDAHKYENKFETQKDFSEDEKDAFRASLEIEVGNASFYKAASEKSSDDLHRALFKALMKVEWEHASIFSKHLGIKKPDFDKSIDASNRGSENLGESHRRERIAIDAYKRFLNEATTPRAKEVFKALVEVETDHIGIKD